MATKCVEVLSAEQAYKRAAKNQHRRYPSPEVDSSRLYPSAAPVPSPSFTISKNDTIFAMGSCFARRIEEALARRDISVLSRNYDLGPVGKAAHLDRMFFNKYTILSMVNELKWALERDSFPGADIYYQYRNGSFCDLQQNIRPLPYDMPQLLDFKNRCLDVTARATQADVIVITLGLAESWYDKVLGISLNVAPSMPLIRRYPGRFEFQVLGYNQVLEGLNTAYTLLKQHRTSPLRMLLTVSPVPLFSTFRGQDVLVANAYSKAVQRAAVDQFVAQNSGVDYFPSYEFVTLSDPEAAWVPRDFRHVRPKMVQQIMNSVLEQYLPHERPNVANATFSEQESQTVVEALKISVRLLGEVEKPRQIVEILEQHPVLVEQDPELGHSLVRARLDLRNIQGAVKALNVLFQRHPDHPSVAGLIRDVRSHPMLNSRHEEQLKELCATLQQHLGTKVA